jgi:hypothetical protein
MTFAICFDFPNAEGDPWFGKLMEGQPGLTPQLDEAQTFASETLAEGFLDGYGPWLGGYATVVEVEA